MSEEKQTPQTTGPSAEAWATVDLLLKHPAVDDELAFELAERVDRHFAPLREGLAVERKRFQATADQLIRTSNDRDQWRACAERLAEELSEMKAQHGCACGHPACRRCGDTRAANVALADFEKLKGTPP